MPDFSSVLNRKREDIKDPVTVPPGHYALTVLDYEERESSIKHSKGFRVFFRIDSPQDDVDLSDLEEGFNTISHKKLKDDFWLVDKDDEPLESEAMFRDFLDKLFGTQDWGSYGEALPQMESHSIIGRVGHELIGEGDDQRPIARIQGYVAA